MKFLKLEDVNRMEELQLRYESLTDRGKREPMTKALKWALDKMREYGLEIERLEEEVDNMHPPHLRREVIDALLPQNDQP